MTILAAGLGNALRSHDAICGEIFMKPLTPTEHAELCTLVESMETLTDAEFARMEALQDRFIGTEYPWIECLLAVCYDMANRDGADTTEEA